MHYLTLKGYGFGTMCNYWMMTLYVAFLFCSAIIRAGAQTLSDPFIPCDACEEVYLDPLGGIYLINKRQEIIKYDKSGKELYRYSNRFFGKLSALDVLNPQKILLFYRDLQTIIFLDNTLSELDRIAIEDWGYPSLPAVALSNDNQIWAYDQIEMQLLKLNRSGEVLLRSDPLSLVLSKPFVPDFIIERNNTVVLQDLVNGVLVFDQFGQFMYDTGLRVAHKVRLTDAAIYVYSDGQFSIHQLQTRMNETESPGFPRQTRSVILAKNTRYILTEKGLIRKQQ